MKRSNMNSNMKSFKGVAVLVLLLAVIALPAFAAQSVPTTVTVTPSASNGGVNPTFASNAGEWQAFYDFGTTASISDTIPVQLSASSTATSWTVTLHFGPPNAGNMPGVTLPSDVTLNQSSSSATVYISINTGALASGPYNENFHVSIVPNSDSPRATLHDAPSTKGFHLTVQGDPQTIRCFTTDSDFNFLTDCAGNPVTSGSGGRFVIVTNNKKNIEVATNPGQFYYNVLWTNTTGSDQVVGVTFALSGVAPQGAQAIHARAFPNGFVVDAATFELVNDSIPGGSDPTAGIQNITVKAGWTLWVDLHLSWSGIGLPVPSGIATTCGAANQPFSVTATVTSGAGTLQCAAGASGYRQ